jgi:hypothetical protein
MILGVELVVKKRLEKCCLSGRKIAERLLYLPMASQYNTGVVAFFYQINLNG